MAEKTIESDISNLLQRAMKENREDVVAALRHLTPVYELAMSLATTLKPTAAFTDEWRGLLTRKSYDLKDGRALTSSELMKNGEYREFLLKRLDSLSGQESAHHIIHGLISAGFHSEALLGLTNDEQVQSFKSYFQGYLAIVTAQHKHYYLSETGQTVTNTRNTIKILDMLDLDFPADFQTTDYPKPYQNQPEPWSSQRIEVNIELVGSVLDEQGISMPELSLAPGGGYKWADSALPSAVLLESQRVRELGGWHAKNFPKYMPAIAPESSLPALLAMGAVLVSPEKTHRFTSNRGASFDTVNPSRTFVPVASAQGVTPEDIRLAFSFFSPQIITGLINSDSHIVMIPLQVMPSLAEVEGRVPAELKTAIRFHRPELLINDESQVVHNATKRDGLALYLKGFNVRTAEYSNLDIADTLARKPEFIESLLPEEVDTFAQYFVVKTEYARDFNKFQVYELPTLSTSENVALAKRSIEALTKAIGYPPAVHYRGSPEFIQALAAAKVYSCDRSAVSNAQGMSGDWYSTPEGIRCAGTLGQTGGFGEYADIPFDELVLKGTRLKDPAKGFNSQKQVILGILDRYPLVEVVALAKTESQYKFLADNFDLMPVRHLLPKRIALNLAGKKFGEELGI